MNTMLKKVISLMLCFVLIAGCLPVGAFAAEMRETVAFKVTAEPTGTDSAETESPENETTGAADATTAPASVPTTVPTEGTTVPTEQETEPSTEATEPSTEATESSTEATEPQEIAVTGITLDVTELEVGVGELPVTLTATVTPEDAADKTITWTSSEPGVASVDENGVVTFGYMGEAVITATAGEFSATCVITVGEGAWDTYEGGTVVIAGSDFQNTSGDSSGAATVTSILTQIQEDYPTADGLLFGGDYSQNTTAASTRSGQAALDAAVDAIYPNMTSQIYIQGNHDPDETVGNPLATTGAHDTDAYGIYAINEKDYMWGNDDQATIKQTAADLDSYLDAKADAGYSKPIFVITHLPLHYSPRITSYYYGGDGKYAKYIYDVLDEAGEKGLNIIFMFGHNHSSTYDDYLGGGAIYLPVGSTITIAGEGNTSLNAVTTDTLSFTYMNCGYVGYSSSKADSTLNMSVFEITDNQVVVKRYSTSGEYKYLKAKGVTTSGAPAADTSTVASGATIELTTPTVEEKVEKTDSNVTVSAPGLTGLTVTKTQSTADEEHDAEVYSAYASYDITPVGYEPGKSATVTITLDEADGFDPSRNVIVIDVEMGTETEAPIVDGTVTFTTNHFSVYDVAQAAETGSTVTPEGGDWVTISSGLGGTIYTLDTNGVSTGEDYLIVSTGADGTAQALRNNNGSVASAEVTISDGRIVTGETDIVWTYDSSKYLSNGSHFFYLSYNNSTNFLSTSEKRAVAISSNSAGEGAYTVKRDGSNYAYYLRYNSGSWTNGSSSDDVYFFVKSGTEAAGDALYGKLSGNLEYTVSRGATAEEALARVKEGITILYHTGNADAAQTFPDDGEGMTWVLDSSYDGTVPGEYAVTISYNDVVLGIAKVIVPEVTINGITVNPASGTVTVGASEAALVGATITVDVADDEGEDFTVPVTVGMLRGTFDTKTADTYEGLTVSYNGFTVENFTLTVKEKVVNNYPSYPNEGAVKVDKRATGINFQETGVAKVELMASGIPMNQGVDVLLVLDTSSSMGMQGSLTDSGSTRMDVLKDCVNALIQNLKKDRPDGSQPDIDIAIVDFNGYTGNKNTNYIGSTARSTSTLGGQLTDGWVNIKTLDDNWGDSNIPQGSGTNYDHGLLQAYDLLSQKQIDDPGRKQFVLFMSDGAPFQYNGVNSNSLSSDWENWILGSYTKTEVEALQNVNNPEFYFGNNDGNGQKHRVAEAIKGAPANQYQIVTYSNTSSSGVASLKEVSGLGAIMYSVGLALEGTNMPTDVAGQEAILTTIASSEDVFYSVTSAAGLQEAFDDFAGAILYAAENAYFVDVMGESYNIQMANTTVRTGTDGKVFPIDPAPSIDVRAYDIWTRDELEDANGNLSEENAKKVGTRKTDTNGNFIYQELESVTFNDAGTEAYTGGDETTNILIDDVICAKTFWYNTSKTETKKVDYDGDGVAERDLAPETFLWKIGDITTKELVISYYVYLDESLSGEQSAGSYATNKSAVLYYDNYLGNPCKKETVSPTMAWLSANIRYAYYLVNNQGQIVNANGEVVPSFANRVTIVEPTKAKEIKLNTISVSENLEVASDGVLDGNYALFDYGAKYTLTVNSDATGSWNIAVGTDAETGKQLPLTTYVTGFSETVPFTNDVSTSSEDDGYDYTHTTVWFAVVWEPDAKDDTVVIDYGLPVDVHVLTNDFFGDFGTLEGVAAGTVTNTDGNNSTNEVPASDAPAKGTFGTAQVMKPETGANESNSVIRYIPSGMEMNGKDVFTYSVEYTNTKLHTNNGFYYGTLTVIPATTIYYEDEFVDLSSYTWEGEWKAVDENDSRWTWTQVVDEGYDENAEIRQDEDRPDDINFAFDTVIDADNIYGFDSAYTACSEYSLGSALKAHVDYDNYAQAEFTFYGTGFDVISLTSNQTGSIFVEVRKGDEKGEMVRDLVVDTFYGYSQNENGEWVVTPNDPAALYQVPVMEVSGLEYGKYHVAIKPSYLGIFDHGQYNDESYDFYLDAIRIYDPANDGASDDAIKDAYVSDNEGWPYYEELRNNVIAEAEMTGEDLAGIVFIDSVDDTASVADYANVGPNNELYLAPGQAIGFDLDQLEHVASVHLGIKSATKNVPVSYKIFAGDTVKNADDLAAIKATEISSATGMYYDITALKDKTIVVYNSGSTGMLSLTDIKITFTENPGIVESVFYISAEDIEALVKNMNTPAVTPPEKFDVTTTPVQPTVGTRFTITVTTSNDVNAVSVNGVMFTGYTRKAGNRVWTARMTETKAGDKTITVNTYDANGNLSATKEAKVTVNSVAETVKNTVKTIMNGLKSIFGWTR